MNGSAFLSMIPMRVAISIAFMATMLPDLSVIANFSHSTKWQRSDICKYELHVNCENKLASRSFSVIEVLAQFTKASTGRHVSGFDVSVFLSLVKIENLSLKKSFATPKNSQRKSDVCLFSPIDALEAKNCTCGESGVSPRRSNSTLIRYATSVPAVPR